MAINIPNSAKEVEKRIKTDVQLQVPASNPFLKNSWIGGILTGFANRVYDYYLQLKEAINQSLPDTATDTILERWAAIWGQNRLAATLATGNIIAIGTASSSVPIGTLFSTIDGVVYESTATVVITNNVLSVTSLVRSGTTVTVTTDVSHNLSDYVPVTIAGAVETEYNVTDTAIIVTGDNTFTYEIVGSPSSPATGTITAAFTSIAVPVTSQDYGEAVNQPLNTELTLQSPIAGVDNKLYVDNGEIAGGTDQETDDGLRSRLLDRIQNPVAHFNVNSLIAKAKEINGVTRVFVQEVTPAAGQVTVYFMRDNDDDPIPSAAEVTTVKNKLLEIKPVNILDADVIVSAPTPVSVDFTFTSLSPNSVTMQTAIQNHLQQFFDEVTEVGVNIDEDLYRAAIANTVDPETGNTLSSFVISAPSGDVVIASTEIGVLGVVTFP